MVDKSTTSGGNSVSVLTVTASGNCQTACNASKPSVTGRGFLPSARDAGKRGPDGLRAAHDPQLRVDTV